MGKLNVAKMANFMEVDLFVLVACPENTLIDTQVGCRTILITASDKRQTASTREILFIFSISVVGSLKSLYWVSRGWGTKSTAYVPTQGQRAAKTRDERPLSLVALGSDPQLGIKPKLHCWEADVLLISQLSSHVLLVLYLLLEDCFRDDSVNVVNK